MISAFFFQYNKIEFDGEEKRENKNLTKRVEQSCVLYTDYILSLIMFRGMNQINIKLICKWKMIFYASGRKYLLGLVVFSFHRTFSYDDSAATARQSHDQLANPIPVPLLKVAYFLPC